MKTLQIRFRIAAIAIVMLLTVGITVALTTENLLSDHPFLKGLFDKLVKHQAAYRPEKVYVHFDKTLYKPGESIWLSAYIRDAQTLEPSKQSDIVYVEFINPRGAVEKSISIIAKNGQAAGDFQIAPNAKGGTYKLKAYTKWQGNTSEFFERDIQVQAVVLPNLNMKLEFERDAYGPGVPASAQLNLESLDKQVLANHSFNYVVSFDGKETLKGSGKTDEKGVAKLSFDLPKDLNTNDAILNVMFQYKGQTESISRSVPVVLGNIDLQFFPEGGELVAGLSNAVAFKALDEFGKAADVSGVIVDQNGKKVAEFNSYHKGMGKFEFRPMAGKQYTARIEQPSNVKGTFTLPAAKANAVTLRLRGQNRQEMQVDVLTNAEEELFVVAQSGGKMIFSKAIEALPGVNSLSIPTSTFPVGIAQISIFDSKQMARAERMAFVNPHKQLKVKVKSKKERYMPRELVEMDIEVSDEYGRPVAGQFSVAVADDKLLTFADDKQGHILAYSLLESDLKGKVEEPNFYFDDESDASRFKPETDRKLALDNLLMTQGWTRFVWKEVQDEKYRDFAQKAEKAVFAGKVLDTQGKPLAGADITIGQKTAKTDAQGMFSLAGVELYQPISMLVSGTDKYPTTLSYSEYTQSIQVNLLGKRTVTGVVTDKKTKKPLQHSSIQVYGTQYITVQTNEKGEYKIEFPENSTYLYAYYGGYSQYIDLNQNKSANINFEVEQVYYDNLVETTSTGNGSRSDRSVTKSSTSAKRPSGRNKADNEMPMIGEVHHVPMNNAIPAPVAVPEMFEARDAEPMIAKDADKAGMVEEKAVEDLEGEIDFGLDDQIMDGRALAKDEKKKMDNKGAIVNQKQVAVVGVRYYRAREFYAPKYEDKKQPTLRNDFRSTVYWNPSLNIGKNGKASISFYNSDDITQFRVSVEGFGNNGSVGRAEYKYFIQLPVELIVKIPTELLTEDKVFIPITLTNNTDETVTGQLIVSLPANIRFINTPPTSVTLAAREGKTILAEAVVNNDPADGTLTVSFDAKGLKDQMSVAIKTRPRGFPVRILHSGDKLSDAVKFNIKEPISGSLKAKLRVYPSSLDQVMGGMESMLRMPGGCFEQTSSSNYPNILALNYLRETNSSNPKIEKQVREYLEVGYGRLTGYESKGGGFDWWGRDPAHEALTAYGLMQFIDMKAVYPVDPKLIERTTKWLMGRRDGKGSWDKNPNCLHSWATSEITDAYIVYAMTEAGLGKDIAKELDKSYKDAVKSEDPYLMGLVVNALYNVQDKRADELMRELMKTQKADGSFMGLTASVVNSTGSSLKIETTGLACLAMMKNKAYMKQLGSAVANIQASKDYYGYGSTQGTVLALKAILGYTKMSKRAAESGIFAVHVNGKKVISVPFKADDKDIVIPDLTPFLASGEQKVDIVFEGTKSAMPYELELTYNTRLPSNSDKCELQLATTLPTGKVKMGETVRMNAQLKSVSKKDQPIVMAMIGIPAGLSVQIWQLKELQEKKAFDFYEIFDGYVVLHYEFIRPGEVKTVNLDLKADIPGQYEAPASCAFLYYTQAERVWSKPELMTIN